MSRGKFITSGNNKVRQLKDDRFFYKGPSEKKPLTVIIKLLKAPSTVEQAL